MPTFSKLSPEEQERIGKEVHQEFQEIVERCDQEAKVLNEASYKRHTNPSPNPPEAQVAGEKKPNVMTGSTNNLGAYIFFGFIFLGINLQCAGFTIADAQKEQARALDRVASAINSQEHNNSALNRLAAAIENKDFYNRYK